jgi:cytochrome c551
MRQSKRRSLTKNTTSISFHLSPSIVVLCVLSISFYSCSVKSESDSKTFSSTKFDQYYLQGEQLYTKRCSNCHQKSGRGLGLVYPPLNKSDFMENNVEKVICLMTHGINGELYVNGKNFNKKMPGIPSLTDLEVAEIATYIYNTWEHKRGIVDVTSIQDKAIVCAEAN